MYDHMPSTAKFHTINYYEHVVVKDKALQHSGSVKIFY